MISFRKIKAADSGEALFPDVFALDEARDLMFAESEEGQLAVDVFETDREIILKSAIAGVSSDDLDVFLHNDMLTVRGVRRHVPEGNAHYMVRECHWGPFSRSVILPKEISEDEISAVLKDGVLTVRMPKADRSRRIAVNEI
ncbi:MAG: Hsp20/alpha crystallin family protein [bacterium]